MAQVRADAHEECRGRASGATEGSEASTTRLDLSLGPVRRRRALRARFRSCAERHREAGKNVGEQQTMLARLCGLGQRNRDSRDGTGQKREDGGSVEGHGLRLTPRRAGSAQRGSVQRGSAPSRGFAAGGPP